MILVYEQVARERELRKTSNVVTIVIVVGRAVSEPLRGIYFPAVLIYNVTFVI
jgi:hypothetical protein